MAANCLKLIFIFSCILGVLGDQWVANYLHVTYALFSGYFPMPATKDDALKQGYVHMANISNMNVGLYTLPGDVRVATMYDIYGTICGLRLSYIIADIDNKAKSHGKPFPNYFQNKSMYFNETYYNTSVISTDVFFRDPDSLKAGQKQTYGTVATGVWLNLTGKFSPLPTNECDAVSQGFTKQNCFIGMGQHYFYGMTKDAKCQDLQGVFLLYECGQLIGLGVVPFGSSQYEVRKWYEDPPASVIKMIVPNRPDCLLDWVTDYGAISLHIFFKKYPRLTFCFWPYQDNLKCEVEDFINDEVLDVINKIE